MRRVKYGNKNTDLDGYHFASKFEASVYGVLKIREKAGELACIECQTHVHLTEAEILFIPDFKFLREDGVVCYAEAKGFETAVWRIKRRLWKYYGPGPLEVWKQMGGGAVLVETIIPVGPDDLPIKKKRGRRKND